MTSTLARNNPRSHAPYLRGAAHTVTEQPLYESEVRNVRSAPGGGQAPAGRANLEKTVAEVKEALEQIAADMGLDAHDPTSVQKANWVRDSFDRRAVTIVNGPWPGKELLDITHLTGKAIVTVNERHPFVAELLGPLKTMASLDPEELDRGEVSALLDRLSVGMDLLLMAYAKAERMHGDPDEAHGDLRGHWGMFAAGLLREAGKRYG